jgi:sulfate permease, SulP family
MSDAHHQRPSAHAAVARPAGPGPLQRYLPILQWLPHYQSKWLAADFAAGLSVWALLVPQGLAYASVAGVPVQYGLYTAFAALIAYAIFGTSRQMVQGPSATVAAVSAAVITPLVGATALGTSKAAPYAAALALVAGGIYVLLGLLRMGWVSNFLSKAVLAGFILGFAIGIIIDQSHKLFGVDKVDGTYVQVLIGTIMELPDTNLPTLVLGATALAVLLGMRQWLPKWPRALIVMALSILAVGALDLASQGVKVTGEVPTGLFSIGLPGIGWSDADIALLAGAFSVIFVGYSESLASARMMSLKHGHAIDPDQELIAQGVACGAAGLVGGFANDGSLSKTSVADTAGQKTQMASLINAVLILATMLFLASLFADLASAVLGAVVIDAMVGLLGLAEFKRYYRVNRPDWVFFMGAMLGILLAGIIQGILIGVVLSLLALLARASKPVIRRLGRDPRTDSYLDVALYPGLELVPGVLVVRMDGPLFFADADRFRDTLKELIAGVDGPVTAVVVDADAISQTDTDGADIIALLAAELKAQGVTLALARVQPAILELWTRAGAIDAVGADRVFDTVREAAQAVKARPAATAEKQQTS